MSEETTRTLRTVPDEYRIELFEDCGEVTREDVLALWSSAGAVDDEEARRRLDEVLHVGLHADAGLVAVSTAYLHPSPQLRTDMWHYRVFTAEEHRSVNLMAVLTLDAWDHLARRYETGQDRRAPGGLIEIENEGLKRWRPDAVWQPSGTYFIGENAVGAHVLVRWFPGATVPVPPAPGVAQ